MKTKNNIKTPDSDATKRRSSATCSPVLKHDYKWFGDVTSRCQNCKKIMLDKSAENDTSECKENV